MALKLLRTIRLDPSDSFVFERAAAPEEWCVPGSFQFWDCDPLALPGKARQAFRAGFLGLTSFGYSTLAVVSPATLEERAAAIEALAHHLVAAHGAPDLATARRASVEEIDFTATLCRHPDQTLIALHRTVEDGAIREQFRTLHTNDRPARAFSEGGFRAFSVVEIEGPDDGDGTAGRDEIDLTRLINPSARS